MPFAGARLMEILSAICNQDHTALQIVDAVKQATKGRIKIPIGSIYTQLSRLEDAGLVKAYDKHERTEERRGRPRRYYKLTGAGSRVLNDIDAIREAQHA